MIVALPSLANVGALLLVIVIVYALVGMQLFGNTMYGNALNSHANFDSFGTAFITLVPWLRL